MADALRRWFRKVLSRLSPRRMRGGAAAPGSVSYDYYISTTGSDSNDGSLGSPWAITALNTKRATYAGKRVGLLDGNYDLYTLAYPGIYWSDVYLNIAGGTDSSNRTVVQAVNPRMAILDGSEDGDGLVFLNSDSETRGGGLIGAVGSDRSYVTLKDIVVRNHFGTAIVFGYQASSGHDNLTKVTGILVEGCEVYDTNGITDGLDHDNNVSPVQFYHTENSTIRNCYIHDTVGETPTLTTHTTSILWWDVKDSVIEYCTFKMTPNPIMFKGAPNVGNAIRYNYMENDPARNDVSIRIDNEISGNATEIHNNVMNGSSFISFSVAPMHASAFKIFNNTFVENTISGIAHHQSDNATKWLSFYNNILNRSDSSIPGCDLEWCEDSWTLLNYNCYSPNDFSARTHPENDSSSASTTGYTTLASWQTRVQSSLANAEAGSFQDDPEFVATGTDAAYYALGGTSPCLTAGKSDGTSGGSNVAMGAWGGSSPPSRIGKDF